MRVAMAAASRRNCSDRARNNCWSDPVGAVGGATMRLLRSLGGGAVRGASADDATG